MFGRGARAEGRLRRGDIFGAVCFEPAHASARWCILLCVGAYSPRVVGPSVFAPSDHCAPLPSPTQHSQPSGAIRCVSTSLSCHPSRARSPFSPHGFLRDRFPIAPSFARFLQATTGLASLRPPPISNHHSLPIDIPFPSPRLFSNLLSPRNILRFTTPFPDQVKQVKQANQMEYC